MDLFKNNILNYFNNILKNYLGYPETFNIKFTPNKIILKPCINSELLKMIEKDTELNQKLLNEISNQIKIHFPNVININIESNIIIFNYDSNENLLQEKLNPLGYIGVYANISYTLDPNSLNNFCSIDPKMNEICKRREFWTEMIRLRFPYYYLPNMGKYYNMEYLYKGLYLYEKIKEEKNNPLYKYLSDVFILINSERIHDLFQIILNKYPDVLEYLLNNNLINLSRADIKQILSQYFLLFDFKDIITNILLKYPIDKETYIFLIKNFYYDLQTMELLLFGDIKDENKHYLNLNKKELGKIIIETIEEDKYYLDIEEFKFYYNYIYGIYNTDFLIDFLLKFKYLQPITTEYIFNKMSDKISVDSIIN